MSQKYFEIEINKKLRSYKNKEHKFGSFGYERKNNHIKWFIRAHDYWEHLADKLYQARETIYIADWWLSPELPLKRPFKTEEFNKEINEENKNILKNILYIKAQEGVKVNILVYKEVDIAMTNNSHYVKTTFGKLHKNIKVTRHPKNSFDFFWSNHEKIVIIDQIYAYIGGIDLCWGRYDSFNYSLFDKPNEKGEFFYPGIDYNNARIKDFDDVTNIEQDFIDRSEYPRIPWHDIQIYAEGQIVMDISRHFIERWNFARSKYSQLQVDKKYGITSIKTRIDLEKYYERDRSINNNQEINKISKENSHHEDTKTENIDKKRNKKQVTYKNNLRGQEKNLNLFFNKNEEKKSENHDQQYINDKSYISKTKTKQSHNKYNDNLLKPRYNFSDSNINSLKLKKIRNKVSFLNCSIKQLIQEVQYKSISENFETNTNKYDINNQINNTNDIKRIPKIIRKCKSQDNDLSKSLKDFPDVVSNDKEKFKIEKTRILMTSWNLKQTLKNHKDKKYEKFLTKHKTVKENQLLKSNINEKDERRIGKKVSNTCKEHTLFNIVEDLNCLSTIKEADKLVNEISKTQEDNKESSPNQSLTKNIMNSKLKKKNEENTNKENVGEEGDEINENVKEDNNEIRITDYNKSTINNDKDNRTFVQRIYDKTKNFAHDVKDKFKKSDV